MRVLRRPRWGRSLATFVAAGLVFQLLTLGQPPLALGFLLLAALAALLWYRPAARRAGRAGVATARDDGRPRLLIAFASSHGQTRRIAERIAEHLRHDLAVDLRQAGEAPLPSPAGYAAVVLGSRVHSGAHARAILDYVRRHRGALERMPTAFFSVSMSAAGESMSDQAHAALYLDGVTAKTGWRPGLARAFAGALPYTRYNVLLRLVMRRMSQKGGQPTDTSRDHEFTDWIAVERFAAEVGAGLRAPGDAASSFARRSVALVPPPAASPPVAPAGAP